jgi:hypothetical protein
MSATYNEPAVGRSTATSVYWFIQLPVKNPNFTTSPDFSVDVNIGLLCMPSGYGV